MADALPYPPRAEIWIAELHYDDGATRQVVVASQQHFQEVMLSAGSSVEYVEVVSVHRGDQR